MKMRVRKEPLFFKVIIAGLLAMIVSLFFSCQMGKNAYESDKEFLTLHTDSIELMDGNASALITPQWQGRIMTSSSNGKNSTGWINYDLVESGKTEPHMSAFGGEERLWLGPEGGQFSIYFPEGADFIFDNWQVPALLDSKPFSLIQRGRNKAVFKSSAVLTNWSGTQFSLDLIRTVKVFGLDSTAKELGLDLSGISSAVMTESNNLLKNSGETAWDEKSGMLSIWVLCMLKHGENCSVVIPLDSSDLSESVVDDYFGKVPEDRLKVEDDVLFFKADGKYRSKIGIPWSRAVDRAGSYDSDKKMLTLLIYNRPTEKKPYVNSLWKLQDKPFSGDVINSYNDGEVAPGKGQLGPFYELESSSPAADLAPGETMVHINRIVHLLGSREALNRIAEQQLNASLEEIENFNKGK